MRHARRFGLPIVGFAAVASLAFTIEAPTAIAAATPLTLSAHSITPGGSITVGGAACTSTDVTKPAWLSVDIVNVPSHTNDVAQGNATPNAAGGWSIQLSVSSGVAHGSYDVLATCLTGSTPATSTVVLTYATATITIGATVMALPPPTKTVAVSSHATHAKATATSAATSTSPAVAAVTSAPPTLTATPADATESSPSIQPNSTAPISAAAYVNHSRGGSGSSALLATIVGLAVVAVAASAGVFFWRRREQPTS